ncbi:class III lanthionine synthetase LanKC [Embleya sp. NBC_00888]|uniref:class III lanthionine synthetase LanKC n=1 Tax=Embleya sp. NBC_00888 TaxID=2975960 RepID=UPI0038636EA0|nr:class III lanthionine synthetase LanKC [Embleya sp. NBC_00888]
MESNHHLFGWSDLVFYDTPSRCATRVEDEFAATTRELPAEWLRYGEGVWVVLRPEDVDPPSQGWKIHISATLAGAPETLDIVWEYCVARGLPFKHLRDAHLQLVLGSKYAPRASGGKVVVLYPHDEAECHAVLKQLSARLDGRPGPYVLSDLRWGNGPLYVRYGAFREMRVLDEDDELVAALERPDGKLVPDRRRPTFSVPGWVTIPDFLQSHLAVRNTDAGTEFPYRIERALHFSNGGGVYLAERLVDGRRVVLKEARPGAGLDRGGDDAVARLRRERAILEQLADIPEVPRVEGYFTVWEHEFLVLEERVGEALYAWAGRTHALLRPDPGEEDVARYTERALALLDRVRDVVERIHALGVCLGDLHPGNILVDEGDTISLLDFETAFRTDEAYRPSMGAQGFAAPWCPTGEARDRYALAALRLWAFLPNTRIFPLGPTKVEQTLATVLGRFPIPDPEAFAAAVRGDMGVVDGRVDRVAPDLAPALAARRRALLGEPADVDPAGEDTDWDAVCASLAETIRLSATPERADRLHPGDPRQFRDGPAAFAHGAAGVLWALTVTGRGCPEEHVRWLLAAVDAGPPRQPGFHTGLHGTAYTLDRLGHPERAHALLHDAYALTDDVHGVSLFTGLSGIGLNALHFAQRHQDEESRRQAERIAERIVDAVTRGWRAGASHRPGLMHGWSGAALFLVRCFEATGDKTYLDRAVEALGRDLDECVLLPDGTLQVLDPGRRTLGYLATGSAGIALVADEVLVHREEPRLGAAIRAIAGICRPELAVESHLFNGRAGLIATLARLRRHDLGFDPDPVIAGHLRRSAAFALSYRGHLAFAGDQSLRLSMDLATGNAGVLLGLTVALDPAAELLPFLRTDLGRTPAEAPRYGLPIDRAVGGR